MTFRCPFYPKHSRLASENVDIFPGFSPEFKEPGRDCITKVGFLSFSFVTPEPELRISVLLNIWIFFDYFFKFHNILFSALSICWISLALISFPPWGFHINFVWREREKKKKELLGVKKVILQENSTWEKRGGDRHQQMSEDRQH